MLKLPFCIAALVLLFSFSYAQTTRQTYILFENKSDKLGTEAKKSIDSLAAHLTDLRTASIQLAGHTDNVGSEKSNLQLSRRRAEAVKRFLLGKGADNSRITVAYYGESRPHLSNATEEWRIRNRRVDVVIAENDKERKLVSQKKEVGETPGKQEDLAAAEEEMKRRLLSFSIAKKAQAFSIDPARDNTIRGQEGTILSFKKNTLVDEHGQPAAGKVTIELTEFLKLSDMIQSRLTTTSDGRPLGTGGMVHVNATQGDRQLFLKKGAAFTLDIPAKSIDTQMRPFYGEINQGLNWRAASELDLDLAINDKHGRYIFELHDLFWINIDRYLSWPDKSDLTVETNNERQMQIFVILKGSRSILPMKYGVRAALPRGEKATLIAVSPFGEPLYYGRMEIVIGQKPVEKVEAKAITHEAFQKDAATLDL